MSPAEAAVNQLHTDKGATITPCDSMVLKRCDGVE